MRRLIKRHHTKPTQKPSAPRRHNTIRQAKQKTRKTRRQTRTPRESRGRRLLSPSRTCRLHNTHTNTGVRARAKINAKTASVRLFKDYVSKHHQTKTTACTNEITTKANRRTQNYRSDHRLLRKNQHAPNESKKSTNKKNYVTTNHANTHEQKLKATTHESTSKIAISITGTSKM